jgi:hypothetical protein
MVAPIANTATRTDRKKTSLRIVFISSPLKIGRGLTQIKKKSVLVGVQLIFIRPLVRQRRMDRSFEEGNNFENLFPPYWFQ